MPETQALAALPKSSDRRQWSEDEAAVIEAAGLVFTHTWGERKGERVLAPRPIVTKFLHTCERTGLDPLARQIYCIGRAGQDGIEWAIQTGIDGFRVVAERSRQYAGQDAVEWLTEGGDWVPAFVKGKHGAHPLAARVAVYRKDWDRPSIGIALWDEYVQTKRNGEPTAMWAQRGAGQLAKCAEALAFRKAFPQDLSGVYTDDEMQNAVARGGEALEGAEERVPAHRRSRVATRPSDAHEAPSGVESAEEPADAADGRTGPDVVDAEVVDDDPMQLTPEERAEYGVADGDEGATS